MAQTTVSEPVVILTSLANGEDSLYEVVNGQRVEKPFMSVYAIKIAFLLAWYLEGFAEPRKLGRALPIAALFENGNETAAASG